MNNIYFAIEPIRDSFKKTTKKINKNKIENLTIFNSSIEDIKKYEPIKADEIYINYPWSKLLEGILLCEDDVWDAILLLTKFETDINISINPLPWFDKTPLKFNVLEYPNKE